MKYPLMTRWQKIQLAWTFTDPFSKLAFVIGFIHVILGPALWITAGRVDLGFGLPIIGGLMIYMAYFMDRCC